MKRFALKLTLFALGITFVLWIAMDSAFASKRKTRRAEHERQVGAQLAQWLQKRSALQATWQAEAHQREQARLADLAKTMGGPIAMAVRNPDFNIREMLEAAAIACAPPGVRVTVHVDRFTEFEVLIQLNQWLDKPRLAEISACLLRQGTPYLHALHFAHQGRVVAELDRRAIDSVADWAAEPLAEVEKLLSFPESANIDAATAESLEGQIDESQLSGDAKRLAEAQKSFNELSKSWHQYLRSFMETQDGATRVSDLRDLEDLQAKVRVLNEMDSGLASARAFFRFQDREYLRTLEAGAFDPLLVTILVRGFNDRYQRELPYLNQVIDVLAQRQAEGKRMLTGLARLWGQWTINRAAGTVQFTSASARDAYNQATAGFDQTTQKASATLQAWVRWTEARKPE